MTNPNTSTGTTDATTAEPEDVTDDTDTGDAALNRVRREAKSLRARLRDAEASRDALAERVGTYDRESVHRVAAEAGMTRPEDLWDAGVTLDDLRDDAGALDPQKATDAVSRVLTERPHWKTPAPINLDQGLTTGVPMPTVPVTWDRALQRR